MTSAVQFPLMFLSGTFFPIDAMPDALKTVARVLPLTYLGDGLRQVMVDGTPFAPLWVCFAFLARLARRLLRDRGPLLQVAVAAPRRCARRRRARRYQRSSWTMSARACRPPALFGRRRSSGSAG